MAKIILEDGTTKEVEVEGEMPDLKDPAASVADLDFTAKCDAYYEVRSMVYLQTPTETKKWATQVLVQASSADEAWKLAFNHAEFRPYGSG